MHFRLIIALQIITKQGTEITLAQYIENHGKEIIGTNCKSGDFPIIIKFIDAKENLSVQVHPDNDYALKNEHQQGKSEIWYIAEAEQGAYIYYGLNCSISKEEYWRRIKENTLTDVLNKVYVKKGDVFYIPAGTIHAICKGIVVAEIQQSSNVTYRVYDYDRIGSDGKKRELHIEKAVDVSNLSPISIKQNPKNHLVKCSYFTTDYCKSPCEINADEKSFVSLLVLDGIGEIICGTEKMPCKKGNSIFIPASSGTIKISGNLEMLSIKI